MNGRKVCFVGIGCAENRSPVSRGMKKKEKKKNGRMDGGCKGRKWEKERNV